MSNGEPNLRRADAANGPQRRWLIWLTLLAVLAIIVWALMAGADRDLSSLSFELSVIATGSTNLVAGAVL